MKIKVFILSLLLPLNFIVFAQNNASDWLKEIPNPLSPISSPKLVEIIDLLVRFIPPIGLLLATIAILGGGYFILTSAGNEQKARSGKKIILISAICLIFIFLLEIIRDNVVKFLEETFQ